MAASRAQQRHALYRLYATNLSFYTTSLGKWFACPLCLRAILEHDTAIAHIYPEACGGKPVTLCCRECNSRMGASYDHHVVTAHKAHVALRDGAPAAVGARLTIKGVSRSFGVELSGSEGSLSMRVIARQTDPRAIEEFKAYLRGAPESIDFAISQKWCHQGRHSVAVLHSGYLAMFREYGYEYILYAHTAWMRDIFNANDAPSGAPFFISFHAEDTAVEKLLYATGRAWVDDNVKVFAVALPLPEKQRGMRIVLLPGIGTQAANQYRDLLSRPEGPMRIKFEFAWGGHEHRLQENKWKGYLHHIWTRPRSTIEDT